MKLGFDIDDTLINLREHAFNIYKRKLGQEVDIGEFHALNKVNIHEIFGLTEDQGKHMWINSMEEIYFTDCPPYPAAVETLQDLDKRGHEIYYITARPKKHGERTKQWMMEKGFPVRDERFFYGMQDEEKIHIIEELGLDYYFDDKPAVLNTLNLDSLKVFAKDQSYNRHLDIPRIMEWSELTKIL